MYKKTRPINTLFTIDPPGSKDTQRLEVNAGK